MNGTIIENLSNRKLLVILLLLLLIQLISFYIGAFITPAPSSFEQFTATKCAKSNKSQLAIPRYYTGHTEYHEQKNCLIIDKEYEDITFAVQLPFPRDHIILDYSRWMQSLLFIVTLEFTYDSTLAVNYNNGDAKQPAQFIEVQSELLMDVDLGVMDRGDSQWKLYAQRSGLKRTISCHGDNLQSGHKLDCNLVQMFELQSLHYNYYLINFRLRDDLMANQTNQFGLLTDITGVAIHQNGGFTQIWLTFKTVFFLMTLFTLVWYYNRLARLQRQTTLIERILVGLGLVLTQLNAPIELLSLKFDIPFMLFLNDLRQGIFYCVLLSFWIIFVGEHLFDGRTRRGNNNRLSSYLKELLVICIASTSLLIFDLCDRGVQAFDPFVTIWEMDTKFPMIFILTASLASLAYLGFLAYYVYLAYCTISNKQSSLPAMPLTRRLMYQGVIYRFKFLLSATLVCAFSTFLFYVLSQKWQDDEYSGGTPIEWTSAMFITVYAMWNLYVMILLIFYAPSHKGLNGDSSSSEQIEFDCLTDDVDDEISLGGGGGDMKLLQDLTSKVTID